MNDNYSPNLFLFQSYVLEVLKEGKRHIKTAPFDGIDPDALVTSQKAQNIERYHSFFLSAMGYSKTRQISCVNYQKLVRQGLIDKQKLPMNMVSSILTSCSNVGGSTSGSSSLGSVSFSNNTQNQSLYIGNLLKSILLHTYQNTSQIIIGLNYLLQGTRKKYSLLYSGMLEEVYTNFLVKFRQPALNRFTSSYLNGLVDEVQAYYQQEGYVFASRKQDALTNKVQMPIYQDKPGFGKFGRCFICKKEATHFMKDQYLPICSFACKDKTNDLLEQCKNPDEFSILKWILSNLNSGDQIIYSFLYKELQYHIGRHEFKLHNLFSALQSIIQYLGTSNVNRILLLSLSLIMVNWQTMLPQYQNTAENSQKIQKYYKTFHIEILNILQQSIISKDNLDFIYFLKQILKNQQIFMDIFNRYDSQFFQPNILGRMLNILSQYAKRYDAGIEGLHQITKMLVKKYIERRQLKEDWAKFQQITKKKQLKKVIVLFNKKPAHGIKYLKKIFEQKGQIIQQKLYSSDKGILQQKKSENQIQKQQTKEQKQVIPQKQIIEQNNDESINQSKVETQDQQSKKQELQLQNCEEKQIFEEGSDNKQQVQEPETIIDQKLQQYEQKQRQQKVQQNSKMEELQASQKSSLEMSQVSIRENQPKINKSKLTSKHIALFLRQNADLKPNQQPDNKHPILLPAINQTKLGQYFGSNDPQVREVCQAFLQTLDFDGLQFDDMMRITLNSFSLPKETQMVERVIEDIAKRLVGSFQLKNDTQSYQYFYLLLMVQTTNHNPNVRETQKLKMESFLKMSESMMGRIPDKAKSDYQRIIENSINYRMKYSEQDIFSKKYLGDLSNYSQDLFKGQNKSVQSKSLLYYIWQYLVIGLIWPGNNKGLFEAIILLGKNGLAAEQKSFFEALRKQGPLTYTRQTILKLGIQYGNQLYGDLWKTVISLIYNLENQNEYNSSISDKLFTNSANLHAQRLRDFMRALLQFSKSQIKSDSLYNRQLFVLRNINSLLQYNIPRFNDVSDYLWQLLQEYFKDICLHPRKQISMSAIDSLKQLTLKLLKLRDQAVSHDALMDLFVYIFDRSTLQMKDLIANVLLNIITSDLRSGWECLYSILDILDTKDKQLVVRILTRLLRQIGVARLSNLARLHGICMKELKVSNQSSIVEQLLEILWQISQHLNNPDTWLLTIATLKDIFKINLQMDLLQIFVRMCNKCIDQIHVSNIEKEIYSEVMDIFIFLVQLKGSQNKKISTLLLSLEVLKNISLEFIGKYIGGSIGFLNIFQLYLGCNMKLPFSIFFKSKLLKQLMPVLKRQQNSLQFEQLSLWCINQYYDNLPSQVINLKQQDKDFEKTIKALLKDDSAIQKDEENNELIEFHLSYKDYHDKSVIHLVFLDIVSIIYSEAQKHPKIRQKIIEAVIDSYDGAARINKLILLRNFLWKNGFLFSSKHLPGLHKQQHRTFAFIMNDFPFFTTFPLFSAFLDQYLETENNTEKLKDKQAGRLKKSLPKVTNRKNSNEQKQKQNKNLHFYIKDCQLWLNEAQKCLMVGFRVINQELNKEEGQLRNGRDLHKLQCQCISLLQMRDLKKDVCQYAAQTLKRIYEILL